MYPEPVNKPVLDLFNLKGKVVAITGASRGIGAVLAQAFAEANAEVASIYTSESSKKLSEESVEELKSKYGVRAKSYQADVAKPEEIEACLNKIVEDFGKLDVLTANAGVCKHVSALENTPEDFRWITDVNLNGAFFSSKAAGKIFKKQGYGNIIITASISGTIVNVPQSQAAYNASKAGVVQLGKSLAWEFRDFARVNCVSPGYIETEMTGMADPAFLKEWLDLTPCGRMGQPSELKGLYVYLASDASTFVTGADYIIDGGYTLR
ncbi:hypothetical protein YB2330_006119 [Saitoella coloradoensis]